MHPESTRECLCGCGQRIPSDWHSPRLVTGHNWTRRIPPFERFFRWVDYGGPGCWLWRGYLRTNGYGGFALVTSKPINAHRALWIMLHGDPGPGVVIRHRCDNRLCVRPSHLEPGSRLDNARDYWARGGRTDYSGNVRGEHHPHAKMTDAAVRAIRAYPWREFADTVMLARRYGVHLDTIRRIRAGTVWRHLLEPHR